MRLLPSFHGNLNPHLFLHVVDVGSLLELVEGGPSVSSSVLPVAGSVMGGDVGEGATSHSSGAMLSDFNFEELAPNKAPLIHQPQMCVVGCSE